MDARTPILIGLIVFAYFSFSYKPTHASGQPFSKDSLPLLVKNEERIQRKVWSGSLIRPLRNMKK